MGLTHSVADGRSVEVAKIAPIRIEFANRSYITEAFVIGNEPLLGVVPIEAMDLIVDPVSQQLKVNPEHPDYPVFPVKRADRAHLTTELVDHLS